MQKETNKHTPTATPKSARLTTQHAPQPARPWHWHVGWPNVALTLVAVALIVVGFVLMLPPIDIKNTPGGRYAPAPGPGAFDAIRIRTAPVPCVIGFVLMVPAILYVGLSKDTKVSAEAGAERHKATF